MTCAAARSILKEVNPFKVGGTTTVRVAPAAGMDGAFSMLRGYARKTRYYGPRRGRQAFSNSQLWKDASMDNHQLTKTGSRIASHLLAVIAGLILVMIGLLLSVPMVGLPLGIPLGLAGVLICLWGLFGTTKQKPVAPPHV